MEEGCRPDYALYMICKLLSGDVHCKRSLVFGHGDTHAACLISVHRCRREALKRQMTKIASTVTPPFGTSAIRNPYISLQAVSISSLYKRRSLLIIRSLVLQPLPVACHALYLFAVEVGYCRWHNDLVSRISLLEGQGALEVDDADLDSLPTSSMDPPYAS
jgi:hypothetical protein